MKVWAQDEFDLVKTGADGQYRLGKGDFRRVNMRGYTRLILGAGSLLGAANIGANSEIGAHCDFDAGAVIGHGSIIGARCHFGKGAWIKSGCIVGHGVCFGDGAVIERGVELEGGVELPAKVELFGVKNADGRTMLTIAPVIGGTLLTGGVGNVIGSLFGVLINGTISTLVKTNGKLISSWSNIVTAILLCFFIVLQSVFALVKERKK